MLKQFMFFWLLITHGHLATTEARKCWTPVTCEGKPGWLELSVANSKANSIAMKNYTQEFKDFAGQLNEIAQQLDALNTTFRKSLKPKPTAALPRQQDRLDQSISEANKLAATVDHLTATSTDNTYTIFTTAVNKLFQNRVKQSPTTALPLHDEDTSEANKRATTLEHSTATSTDNTTTIFTTAVNKFFQNRVKQRPTTALPLHDEDTSEANKRATTIEHSTATSNEKTTAILTTASVPAPTTYAAACSGDYVRLDGKCFIPKVQSTSVGRAVAEKVCRDIGGQLANLYSQRHMDSIMNYVRRKNMVPRIGVYWLGMKYDQTAKSLRNRDGTPAASLRWHERNPKLQADVYLVVRPASQPNQNIFNGIVSSRDRRDVLCEV